jgi:hypothetical protein
VRNNNAHPLAECSNGGECDRDTGYVSLLQHENSLILNHHYISVNVCVGHHLKVSRVNGINVRMIVLVGDYACR